MMRPCRPRLSSSSFKPYLRLHPRYSLQHHGPHKEYFQNPTSYPPPSQAFASPGDPLASIERPIHRRLLRSLLWATLFCTLGAATGVALKTTRRLGKPTQGSELDTLYMSVIAERFARDPLVQLLEKDPEWQNCQTAPNPKSKPYPFVRHADTYSLTVLGGSQGFQTKCYVNNAKLMLCFVVHVGEGLEWEPGVAHAGGLASFMEDSLDWLGGIFPKDPSATSSSTSAVFSNKTVQIDFFTDGVPSGQLYAFWLLPAAILGEDEMLDALNNTELSRGGRKLAKDDLKRTLVGMFEQRDRMPYDASGYVKPFARARVTYDATPIPTEAKVDTPEP